MNLRFSCINIRAAFEGLLERVLEAKIGRGQERNVVGEIVFVAWW
jgi:hypothetical protein